jgi:hypothetical protein
MCAATFYKMIQKGGLVGTEKMPHQAFARVKLASPELLDCINSLNPAVTVELYLWEKRT